MTANRPPTADELNGVKQDTVQWTAKAHRVTTVDSDGLEIDDANPLPVSMSSDIEIGAIEIKDADSDDRAEVQATNEQVKVASDIPWRVPAKTDIIVSAVATNAAGSGPATTVMRGWLITE